MFLTVPKVQFITGYLYMCVCICVVERSVFRLAVPCDVAEYEHISVSGGLSSLIQDSQHPHHPKAIQFFG